MNKRIILLASLGLFLAAHNAFAMEQPRQRIIPSQLVIEEKRPTREIQVKDRRGYPVMVNVEYNPETNTCTANDITDAVSKAFGLEPGTFDILTMGERLSSMEPPHNEMLPMDELRAYPSHIIGIKK
jgi:hypothetical protein